MKRDAVLSPAVPDLDKLRMPAAEIGQALNRQGCGRCPWCRTGGPMTVGEFGVAWLCGHARRIPPLHDTDKTTAMCKRCTPHALLRAVA